MQVFLLYALFVPVHLDALDGGVAEREPVGVDDIVGRVRVLEAEDLDDVLEGAEVEPDGLGAALLVAGPHRGELGVVGLAGLVKVVHRLPRQRVLQAALEVEAAVLKE